MKEYILCALAAFLLSFVFCIALIPLLRRMKAGQNILSYVKEHAYKSGTPTMGGLAFLPAAALVSLFFAGFQADKPYFVALAVGLGYLVVGFLDDFLKKRHKENLGLRPYQKILFQLAVALIASVYCCMNGLTILRIPFTTLAFDVGWWMLPLGVFVYLATVNGVNLTDGLDGLAGSTCSSFFLALALLILLQGESGDIAILCISLVGAIGAFLLFNVNRASVFMGDTGSLSLGGFAASAALFTGNALAIPFAGIMFVLSSISVIMQVIYYKKTGKRIFLMAPIHHHFQHLGYSEGKISYCYFAITAMMGLLLLIPFL